MSGLKKSDLAMGGATAGGATADAGAGAPAAGRAARPARARAATPMDDDLGPRMGGVALKNGLILVTERNWAAAIREADGSISVASGSKVQVPGSGGYHAPGAADGARAAGAGVSGAGRAAATGVGARASIGGATARASAGSAGIPLLRGLGRFSESLLVLGLVKAKLPNATLPFESGRVAAALGVSMAGTAAVRALAPKSAVVQEVGSTLAAFVPAVLSLKNSAISGYHGAEHKVIGGRETALRDAARTARAVGRAAAGGAAGEAEGGAAPAGAARTVTSGDSAAAAKEHDRCGSNLVGPYLIATILTNLLARGRSGVKTPAASAAAGAASLGLALEALRWANKHGDSTLARLMLSPGRAIQKVLTTSEPTPEQLEVGERALTELLRVEGVTG